MNGAEGMTAIIALGASNLAWPVLFALRKISFTAWPKPPKDSAAAAGTGPAAAAVPSPSGSGM